MKTFANLPLKSLMFKFSSLILILVAYLFIFFLSPTQIQAKDAGAYMGRISNRCLQCLGNTCNGKEGDDWSNCISETCGPNQQQSAAGDQAGIECSDNDIGLLLLPPDATPDPGNPGGPIAPTAPPPRKKCLVCVVDECNRVYPGYTQQTQSCYKDSSTSDRCRANGSCVDQTDVDNQIGQGNLEFAANQKGQHPTEPLSINPFNTFKAIQGGFGFDSHNGKNDVNNFIQDILSIGYILFGGLATLKIIFGGVMYATAAGNAQRISEAKSHILYALLGIALISGSTIILVLLGASPMP